MKGQGKFITDLPSGYPTERLVKSFEDACAEHLDGEDQASYLFHRQAAAIHYINGKQYDMNKAMDLEKSMVTGTNVDPFTGDGLGEVNALRLENLDNTMVSVLFDESHLKLFAALEKVPTLNQVYEWNREKRYGSGRGESGFSEGSAPMGDDGEYSRNYIQVRYLGTRGSITHQAALPGTNGGYQVNLVAKENRRATMDLLQKMERNVLWSDSAVLDRKGKAANYDGLYLQLLSKRSENIIDMRGAPLDFDTFGDISTRFYEEGLIGDFGNLRGFLSLDNLEDLGKYLHRIAVNSAGGVSMDLNAGRYDIGGGPRPAAIYGQPIKGFESAIGVLPFEHSIFLDPVKSNKPQVSGQVNSNAAAAPTVNNIATSISTDTAGVAAQTSTGVTSKMEAGTFYYSVSSVNDADESLAAVLKNADTAIGVVVTAGQQVRIRIPRVTGSGLAHARRYRVYRGAKSDGSDHRFIGWVADHAAQGNGTTVDFIDKNGVVEAAPTGHNFMPDTHIALFFDRRPDNVCISQLSPLIKWPLPVVETTAEFLLMLYHTPVLKAEERFIIVKNIGRWKA